MLDDGRPNRADIASAPERHFVRAGFACAAGKVADVPRAHGPEAPIGVVGTVDVYEDFSATVDDEEIHSVSVFRRDGDRVFHTWQTFNRGEELFMVVFDLLDLTPYGRQETWGDSPEGPTDANLESGAGRGCMLIPWPQPRC